MNKSNSIKMTLIKFNKLPQTMMSSEIKLKIRSHKKNKKKKKMMIQKMMIITWTFILMQYFFNAKIILSMLEKTKQSIKF
jgi:hypothetical protein